MAKANSTPKAAQGGYGGHGGRKWGALWSQAHRAGHWCGRPADAALSFAAQVLQWSHGKLLHETSVFGKSTWIFWEVRWKLTSNHFEYHYSKRQNVFFFCVAGHCSHLPPGAESKLRCKKALANPRVVRCFNLLPWLGVAAYHLDHLDLYWARYGKISDVRCPFPVDFWSVPHGTVVNPGDPWETLATQLRPGDPNTFQVRMTQGLQKH